jgi:hypothetical protein
MSATGYRQEYGDNGVVSGQGDDNGYGSDEKFGVDTKKAPTRKYG